jgi:hypothetical protein
MRKVLACFCILLFLLALASCAPPFFTLTATPQAGYPSRVVGGLLVHFVVSGGGERMAVEFGDGASTVQVGKAFDHLYTQAGTFECEVVNGPRTASCTVTVLDAAPYALEPFWSHCDPAEEGAAITFNSNPGYAGCDLAGVPLTAYGVRDLDGDAVKVRYTAIQRETGKPESLFDDVTVDGRPTYQMVNGQWIDRGLVTWFAGWTGPQPPFPFVHPFDTKTIQVDGYHVDFTLDARDEWGATSTVRWSVFVIGRCSQD